MERCFESKNARKYQGILSPTSTDKSNQNYYIVNSKERNVFGYNVDSGEFNSYVIDEERDKCLDFCDYFSTGLAEYQKLITRTPIFLEGVEGIGIIGEDEALNWGLSGPML
ncbi:unnamed protein product [Withania somnifera]